ncbi:MAG: hypothetical protein Aurels2KO_12050 [Aureliella sp.]
MLLWLLCAPGTLRADWPQFRGNNSDGRGTGVPPVKFSPQENELWSTPVGPGHSSPCVRGHKLFITTFNEKASTVCVECYDSRDGTQLWTTPFKVDTLETGHPSFNPASSSPCCDSKYVVAYFGSLGLICLNHEGETKWVKRLALTQSFGGNATSPIIHDNKVILYRGNYIDHYIACFDIASGEELWKISQTEKFTGEMACTACPIVHGDQLICHSARCVQSFDISSGERNWIAQCATTATSTPIIVGSEVLVAAWNKLGEPDLRPPFPSFAELLASNDSDGSETIAKAEFPKLWIFHRPAGIEAPMNGAPVSFKQADKNRDGQIQRDEWQRTTAELDKFRAGYETHGLLAIPLDSEGHISADEVRVLSKRGIPEVPSPVAARGRVYLVKNGGQLSVIDIQAAEIVHRMRTRGSGTHYASPVVANNRLYTFSGDGKVSVIGLEQDKPKLLHVNEIGDRIYATPAIVEGVIFLRTHSTLYAFWQSTL